MKKLILAAGAVVAMMAATSCGNSQSASSFEDSLSTAMGRQNGSFLCENFKTIPESELYHFKKADVIRGFKEVIMADTAARGYYAGLNIALQMNQQLLEMEESGVAIDRSRFLSAFSKAFMADSVTDMDAIQAEAQKLMEQAREKVMAKQRADMEAAQAAAKSKIAENEAAGKEYIAEQMKSDPTIKQTSSGLAYKVVKEGSGKPAGANDRVKLKYTGKLIDGTEFDSSKGNAVEFVPSQTVPGFSEGLQMMAPGAEYILYIPANLAYGDRETGSIPAGSTLVFEVEVESVSAE